MWCSIAAADYILSRVCKNLTAWWMLPLAWMGRDSGREREREREIWARGEDAELDIFFFSPIIILYVSRVAELIRTRGTWLYSARRLLRVNKTPSRNVANRCAYIAVFPFLSLSLYLEPVYIYLYSQHYLALLAADAAILLLLLNGKATAHDRHALAVLV